LNHAVNYAILLVLVGLRVGFEPVQAFANERSLTRWKPVNFIVETSALFQQLGRSLEGYRVFFATAYSTHGVNQYNV